MINSSPAMDRAQLRASRIALFLPIEEAEEHQNASGPGADQCDRTADQLEAQLPDQVADCVAGCRTYEDAGDPDQYQHAAAHAHPRPYSASAGPSPGRIPVPPIPRHRTPYLACFE